MRSADSCRPARCRARPWPRVRKKCAHAASSVSPHGNACRRGRRARPFPIRLRSAAGPACGLARRATGSRRAHLEADERHRMAIAAFGRSAVVPEIRGGQRPEIGLERARNHQRQRANGGRRMAGLADELRVFGVGDRIDADREIVDVRLDERGRSSSSPSSAPMTNSPAAIRATCSSDSSDICCG